MPPDYKRQSVAGLHGRKVERAEKQMSDSNDKRSGNVFRMCPDDALPKTFVSVFLETELET